MAIAPSHVTFLSDALYSKQPLGALALAKGFHCSLVYKPASHPKLDTRVAFWQVARRQTFFEDVRALMR